MPQLLLMPDAIEDLDEIWSWVGVDHADGADGLVAALRETCGKLANMPEMGRTRDDLLPGLRSFSHGNYVIYYRVHISCVQILRILDGRREIATTL